MVKVNGKLSTGGRVNLQTFNFTNSFVPHIHFKMFFKTSQLTFTCSKSTMKTLEKGVNNENIRKRCEICSKLTKNNRTMLQN